MSKYKIKVSYQTGNSYGRNDTEDYLDLEWNDLEVAKENLKAIKEHYRYYNQIENTYGSKLSNQDIHTEMYNKHWWFAGRRDRWFVNLGEETPTKKDWIRVHRDKENLKRYKDNESELRWDDMSHYKMKLKADNGNLMQQFNFWCGYFETLYGAEIEAAEDESLKFII